jgi:tetratricopeptide (TPR) repeat protein
MTSPSRAWRFAARPAFAAAIIFALPSFAYSSTPAATREAAQRALMQGRADEAIATLHMLTAQNPADAPSHLLLCRAFYSEELADPAVTECEAALQGLASSSDAQDWMGRAYGLKANTAGYIAGYKLARKVQAAFEAAVNLDSRNSAATDDLSEYYIAAPSLIGGGLDKAEALADRIQGQSPQSAHRIHGLVAEDRKDYGTAEREFRSAVGVAGRPDAWVDLGHYYARRKQLDRSLDALHHALAADRPIDASAVDAASILIEIHREPDTAALSLRNYLEYGVKSDAAPAFKALVDLGQLQASQGDKANAKIEFEKALQLAHDYAPAKKALQSL